MRSRSEFGPKTNTRVSDLKPSRQDGRCGAKFTERCHYMRKPCVQRNQKTASS
ncbi:hypothetical protein SERLADRAFT_400647, partial [Serpula lacrymans var. lacrymans S7.9]